MSEMVYCPVIGKIESLENVADEVFSQKILGDGRAVIPSAKEVRSPVDGMINMIYDTKHAIGITMVTGIEILIHMGLDTVMLNGVPFKTQVKVGDIVTRGDLLSMVDWKYIEKHRCDTVISIIAINREVKYSQVEESISVGTPLFEIV